LIKYEGIYGHPVISKTVDVFRLLEISIGDSLGPGTPTLDPIPNYRIPEIVNDGAAACDEGK